MFNNHYTTTVNAACGGGHAKALIKGQRSDWAVKRKLSPARYPHHPVTESIE